MNLETELYEHHASIPLQGEINSETIERCVSDMKELITRYSYSRIEVAISSPGGRADSMLYFIDAMDSWRGLATIDTRGRTHAASAAAIILSLGNRRIAEHTTQLCYHSCRIHTSEGAVLTAPGAKYLGNRLQYQDEKMAERLAERAVQIPKRAWIDYLESERQVAFHSSGLDEQKFCARLFDMRKDRRDEPSQDGEWKLSTLMIKLLKDEEFSTSKLAEIYRNLFDLDVSIPPVAAKMLGLIDAVGKEDAAFARESENGVPEIENTVVGDERSFVKKVLDAGGALPVWEWRELYPDGMPYDQLRCHVLIQGETGSGKSKSGVLPILKAVLKTSENDGERPGVGAVLVIDPKREFGPCLQREQDRGNVKVRNLVDHECEAGERFRLNLMANESSALSDRSDENRYLSEARNVLTKVASIVPDHAAASSLLGKSTLRSAGVNAYWDNQGTSLSLVYLALAMMWLDCVRDSTDRDAFSGACPDPLREVADDFVLDVKKRKNIIFLAYSLLSSLEKKNLFCELGRLLDKDEFGNVLRKHVGVGAIKAWKREYQTFKNPAGGDKRLWYSTLSCAQESLGVFSEPALSETLYFGCEPIIDGDRAYLDLQAVVSADKSVPEILRYCPDLKRGQGALVGKALKASFFNAVLMDPDRSDPNTSDELPLVGYVADECHRFITADAMHGEQSYLDTCRSFGGFCVLACQSTESLKHALSQIEAPAQIESAVSILTQNTATKLYFRSTDTGYLENLKRLLPPGRWGSMLDRRPLFTLDRGECMAVLQDGRVRRTRLDWVDDRSVDERSIV